jgi:hypothetical protein
MWRYRDRERWEGLGEMVIKEVVGDLNIRWGLGKGKDL